MRGELGERAGPAGGHRDNDPGAQATTGSLQIVDADPHIGRGAGRQPRTEIAAHEHPAQIGAIGAGDVQEVTKLHPEGHFAYAGLLNRTGGV